MAIGGISGRLRELERRRMIMERGIEGTRRGGMDFADALYRGQENDRSNERLEIEKAREGRSAQNFANEQTDRSGQRLAEEELQRQAAARQQAAAEQQTPAEQQAPQASSDAEAVKTDADGWVIDPDLAPSPGPDAESLPENQAVPETVVSGQAEPASVAQDAPSSYRPAPFEEPNVAELTEAVFAGLQPDRGGPGGTRADAAAIAANTVAAAKAAHEKREAARAEAFRKERETAVREAAEDRQTRRLELDTQKAMLTIENDLPTHLRQAYKYLDERTEKFGSAPPDASKADLVTGSLTMVAKQLGLRRGADGTFSAADMAKIRATVASRYAYRAQDDKVDSLRGQPLADYLHSSIRDPNTKPRLAGDRDPGAEKYAPTKAKAQKDYARKVKLYDRLGDQVEALQSFGTSLYQSTIQKYRKKLGTDSISRSTFQAAQIGQQALFVKEVSGTAASDAEQERLLQYLGSVDWDESTLGQVIANFRDDVMDDIGVEVQGLRVLGLDSPENIRLAPAAWGDQGVGVKKRRLVDRMDGQGEAGRKQTARLLRDNPPKELVLTYSQPGKKSGKFTLPPDAIKEYAEYLDTGDPSVISDVNFRALVMDEGWVITPFIEAR